MITFLIKLRKVTIFMYELNSGLPHAPAWIMRQIYSISGGVGDPTHPLQGHIRARALSRQPRKVHPRRFTPQSNKQRKKLSFFTKCIIQRGPWVMGMIEAKSFPNGSAVKNLTAMQETQEMWVPSLSQEDPLEKGMATHFSILAWRIPWTEKPGGLQSMG